jgi:signal peptidase I
MKSDPNAAPKAPRNWGKSFMREIAVPLLLAVIVIQLVLQAFRIPSGSMERSLLVGDWLLGVKFLYGSPIPFTEKHLPAVRDPKPGDVIIFHYPMDPDVPDRDPARFKFIAHTLLFGDYFWDTQPNEGQGHLVRYDSRDFIKRCIGVSGDTLTIRRRHVWRNGVEVPLAPNGQYDDTAMVPWDMQRVRDSMGPFRIPKPGETIHLSSFPSDEFLRIYSLAIQEHPGEAVRCSLWVERNGKKDSTWVMRNVYQSVYPDFNIPDDAASRTYRLPQGWMMADYQMDTLSQAVSHLFQLMESDGNPRQVAHNALLPRFGVSLDNSFQLWKAADSSGKDTLRLCKAISIDGKWDTNYTVRQQVLFMMGDNRDHSSDARFWGYLSRRNVKARALIIYFSLENGDDQVSLNPFTWWRIPFRTRWNRIGRLVHD